MINSDNIIQGLKCCQISMSDEEPFTKCHECPYNDVSICVQDCRSELCKDALELLKEQEPIEPKAGKWITRLRHEHYPSGKPYEEDFCSECGKRGSLEYPFCPWCGIKMESGEAG